MKQCAANVVPVAHASRTSFPFWTAAACARSLLVWASLAQVFGFVGVFSGGAQAARLD